MNMQNLPDIASARLPQTYEAAKFALAECHRMDECQNWADKAAALASYAKQAGDTELETMATRIKARAIRRCGELLKQIEPATGAHLKRDGGDPFSRTQAAQDAGLSERQHKTALRVANVPEDQFTSQVESDTPPTITQLANQGKTPREIRPLVDLEGIDPDLYSEGIQVAGVIADFIKMCQNTDPSRICYGFKDYKIKEIQNQIQIIDLWLDIFATTLIGIQNTKTKEQVNGC